MSIVNCVVYDSNGGVFGCKTKKEKDLTQRKRSLAEDPGGWQVCAMRFRWTLFSSLAAPCPVGCSRKCGRGFPVFSIHW